jgi:dihydropyrimidine dehydrogenase (NAD+) subunit PreT
MISDNRLTEQQYAQNFSDIHPPFATRDAALVDANRCLYCYDAPCTKSCPTGIDIPRFIKQAATDDLHGSARTIFQSNIMGGGCARVCPVEKLCEGACVFNLLEEPPIPIARLQRYATEDAIKEKWRLFEKADPLQKKVAIIGAGPSGLSAAHVLARSGVEVTIFEKETRGGGLMTYGIAAYKISPAFCREELDFILSIGGITIRYEQELGRNLLLKDLRAHYDAVYVAIGVGLTRKLDIQGEDLQGVVDAIHFIYAIRDEGYPAVPVGDRVAVIGMGMTAIDAATQAKRLGAKEVTLVYRRTQAEMPCTLAELEIARLDGCRIAWLAAPRSITGTDGRVTRLVCNVMKPGPPDKNARRAPVETGETLHFDVDMIIKATGQLPFSELVRDAGLDNHDGRITTSTGGITGTAGIFAGGDCVNGGKEVVDAVQAGKDAAAAILTYLKS